MRHCAILLLVLFAALLGAGCSNVKPAISEPSTVAVDQTPVLSQPVWYVKPSNFPHKPLNALFLPLRVTADVANQRLAGSEVMRSVWQTWMGMQVFHGQEYMEDQYYRDARAALMLGRGAGADLVVTGELSYYLPGAAGSDSAVSLRLDVYSTRNGKLLWSGSQAGRLEYLMTEDYILFKRQMRMPDSPMHMLVTAIAGSMGMPVRAWARRYVRTEQPEAGTPKPKRMPATTPGPDGSRAAAPGMEQGGMPTHTTPADQGEEPRETDLPPDPQ
jgi:hypothetical protein